MMGILKVISGYLKYAISAELTLQGREITSVVSSEIDAVIASLETKLVCIGEHVFYSKFIEEGRQSGITGTTVDQIIIWVSNAKCISPDLGERSSIYSHLLSLKTQGVNSPFIADSYADATDLYVKLCDTYMEKMFNELKTKN